MILLDDNKMTSGLLKKVYKTESQIISATGMLMIADRSGLALKDSPLSESIKEYDWKYNTVLHNSLHNT